MLLFHNDDKKVGVNGTRDDCSHIKDVFIRPLIFKPIKNNILSG